MQCLTGYIGVKYCNAEPPVSGRYINELPGISIKSMDAIANDEQVSFLGVWADIEKRAIARLKNSALTNLLKTYQLKRVLSNHSTPKKVTSAFDSTGIYRGLELYTNYSGSTLLNIFVQEFSVYSAAAALGVVIKIIDVDTNSELYSTTKDLAIGWNRVVMNQAFGSGRIIIVYLDTNVSGKSLPLSSTSNQTGCTCVCEHTGCEIHAKGVTVSNLATLDDLETGSDSFGISVTAGLQCSFENIICNNMAVYEQAFMYALGMEYAEERINTDRINRYTTLDAKKAKELYVSFGADYLECITNANDSIILKDDACIECKGVISSTWLKA